MILKGKPMGIAFELNVDSVLGVAMRVNALLFLEAGSWQSLTLIKHQHFLSV